MFFPLFLSLSLSAASLAKEFCFGVCQPERHFPKPVPGRPPPPTCQRRRFHFLRGSLFPEVKRKLPRVHLNFKRKVAIWFRDGTGFSRFPCLALSLSPVRSACYFDADCSATLSSLPSHPIAFLFIPFVKPAALHFLHSRRWCELARLAPSLGTLAQFPFPHSLPQLGTNPGPSRFPTGFVKRKHRFVSLPGKTLPVCVYVCVCERESGNEFGHQWQKCDTRCGVKNGNTEGCAIRKKRKLTKVASPLFGQNSLCGLVQRKIVEKKNTFKKNGLRDFFLLFFIHSDWFGCVRVSRCMWSVFDLLVITFRKASALSQVCSNACSRLRLVSFK